MRWISFSLVQSQRGRLGLDCSTTDTPNCAGSVPRLQKHGVEPGWLGTQAACPQLPRASVGGRGAAVTRRGAGVVTSRRLCSGLLCGDKLHDHADDPRTSRTRTQVRAWVFNFILEELVKFTAKFLYQFSYLQWKRSVSCAGRKGEGFHRKISNHDYHSAIY